MTTEMEPLDAEEAQEREAMKQEKIDLEPGMYVAQLLGAQLYTDNKEVADFINDTDNPRVEDFDLRFPGLVEAAMTARKELEMERFVVIQLLHRKGRVQASAGPTYMSIASNWITI